MSEVILVDQAEGIATLTFNRPAVRNAIDQEKIGLLQATLARLENDPAVRVLVLTGAGGHFVAGGDITFFEKSKDWTPEERRHQFESVVHRIHPVVLTLRRMAKPVIAKVRGAAAGWGVSLVMACDLAIPADDARFNLGYTLIGACPTSRAGSPRMATLAGKTLFITGASRGIGLAIALSAAADGANIVIAAKTATPHPKLPGTIYTAAEEIAAAGGACLPLVVDVRDDQAVEQAVAAPLERFGGVHILINNASAISLTG